MILKNQQRLAELQSDIKEVNKIAGEPVVNIRKIKQAPPPETAGALLLCLGCFWISEEAERTAATPAIFQTV